MGKKEALSKLISIFFSGIAFGFIEAACVVYLRQLFYPGIHSLFPLKPMSPPIFRFEVYREIATIILLSSTSFAIAKRLRDVPFVFLMLFGLWDIFYYVFLKFLINWPSSLMEYDILFLIPIPWIAPALAPLMVSTVFIVGSIFYLFMSLSFTMRQVYIFLTAIVLIFVSFILIPIKIFMKSGIEGFAYYSGGNFNFYIFALGMLLLITSFLPVRKIHIY